MTLHLFECALVVVDRDSQIHVHVTTDGRCEYFVCSYAALKGFKKDVFVSERRYYIWNTVYPSVTQF